MKRLWFIFILLLAAATAQAQNAACHTRISLLTCAPGQELYSTFGHTAIRITDSAANTDIVYNYGTFNFDDPQFYIKFVRGKLDYFLSADAYPDFMAEYQDEQRSVTEQELNLDCTEKAQITNLLDKNMQTANRGYKYDFLYDNCTTRVRDLLFGALPGSSINKAIVPQGITSRNLIHTYLDRGGEPWSKLGIDILLGSKLDKPIDNHAAMFLPDYLLKGIDSANTLNAKTIVQQKRMLLNMPSPASAYGNYWAFAGLALVCVLALLLYKSAWAKTVGFYLDSFFLYITGMLGVLLLFMWFGTEHIVCSNNFNLLWALPTNLVAAFFLGRRPQWLSRYFTIIFIVYAFTLVGWFWLPQEFNTAIAPLVVLMLYRSGILMQNRH